MAKRLIIFLIALACLAGLVSLWPRTSSPGGQVMGRIVNRQPIGNLGTTWERSYISDRTGQWKIFLISNDQGGGSAMIPGSQPQLLPTEISNGHWLYFTQEEGFYKLWRFTPDNNASQFILALRHQPTSLAATRDGRLAVYTLSESTRTDNSQRTFLVKLEAAEVKEIVSGARSLIFSPDNRRIVYTTTEGLFSSEISRELAVGDPLSIAPGDIYAPTYAADGDNIYYIENVEGEYLLNHLDLRTGTIQTLISLGVNPGITDWSLELSPDGKKLVYCGSVDKSYVHTVIGRVMVDGSGEKILSQDGGEAHWSKSGQQIYFNSLEFTSLGPRLQIWRMDEEGNNREAVAWEGNNWLSQVPRPIQSD
ncbi:MAG: hypothetical protein WC497_00955 [Patescibacteria group bacterium]